MKKKNKEVEMITIEKGEYERLLKAEAMLDALECAGVDNWCGYGEAMEIYNGEDEDED